MASIKSIQIGKDTYDFNKLQSDNAVVEVVGDTINNFANKLQFGRHVDTSNSENLLVVGNGSGEDAKSNALELTYNGELKAQTEVVVGEHRLTNKLDKEDFDFAEENDIIKLFRNPITKIFLSDGSIIEENIIGEFNLSEANKLKVTKVILGANVTSIGSSAFCKNSPSKDDIMPLEEIYIPETITKIGDGAFDHCKKIKSIVLPKSIQEIGNDCFGRCWELELNINSKLSNINFGNECFYGCKKVFFERDNSFTYENYGNEIIDLNTNSIIYGNENAIIPDYVTKIGNSAFAHQNRLTNIVISDNITYIGDWAFCQCLNLQTITLPSNLTYLGKSCFQYCQITDITIPEGITKIYDDTFDNTKLENINLPTSLTLIGEWAFSNSKIKSITIPDSVTSIGQLSFYNCLNLTSIKLSSNLSNLPYGLFFACKNLKHIEITNKNTTLAASVFYQVPNGGTFYCYQEWYDKIVASSKSRLYNLVNWTKVYI